MAVARVGGGITAEYEYMPCDSSNAQRPEAAEYATPYVSGANCKRSTVGLDADGYVVDAQLGNGARRSVAAEYATPYESGATFKRPTVALDDNGYVIDAHLGNGGAASGSPALCVSSSAV